MRRLLCNGQVFDGENALCASHSVLIEDDRIVEVAPAQTFQGFTDERIDITGATLLPGLIDCHVHLCFGGEANPISLLRELRAADFPLRALAHAQATLLGGVTTVRDLGGHEYAELAVRDAILAGRHSGPTILCAGKMICISGGHGWFVGIEADGADECTKAVRTNVKAGADIIKFMISGGVMTPGVHPLACHQSEEETRAVVIEASRLGKTVACHATGAPGILQAVKAGVTSIEHGFQITDEIISVMRTCGTVLVPTLSAMGCATADKVERMPAYVRERVDEYRQMQWESVRRYYRAGGRIAMGTDAGTPFNHHGANVGELKYMVEVGMEPLDVLRASTSVAADLLRLPDHGRVRAGCVADLLVITGDPLEDIEAVSDPRNHRFVLKRGRIVRGPSMLQALPSINTRTA